MVGDAAPVSGKVALGQLRERVSPYTIPDARTAAWQVIDTCVPYAALWVLMGYLLRHGYPYWTVAVPLVLASAFYVRMFVLFHDCTHGSFLASPRANRMVGRVLGVLTFTPFAVWGHHHAVHHGTYADLDHRGVGDIWTLTVQEYLAAPRVQRWAYRLYRSPWVMFGLGPITLFVVAMRFPSKIDRGKERASILFTNLALAAMVLAGCLVFGWRVYVPVQLAIVEVAGAAGIWLFYVQHQFEGVYWMRHAEWDPMDAAMTGSSHYRLPRLLRWATARIGVHFVHHISPRIPNYRLQECHDAISALQTGKVVTLRRSLRSVRLNLWDEEHRALVSFRSLRRARLMPTPQPPPVVVPEFWR